MALSLVKKPNQTAKLPLYDPKTRETIGTFIIAGPDHPAMKAWQRELNERRMRRSHKDNVVAETKEGLCRRTVGWEGVKDTETGEDVPFDASALPALYEQDWLILQVLAVIGDEDFFFRE